MCDSMWLRSPFLYPPWSVKCFFDHVDCRCKMQIITGSTSWQGSGGKTGIIAVDIIVTIISTALHER